MLRAKIALAAMAAISLGISSVPAAELIPELGKLNSKSTDTQSGGDVVCAVAYQEGPYQIIVRENKLPKNAQITAYYTNTAEECKKMRIPSPKAQKRGADISPVPPGKQK